MAEPYGWDDPREKPETGERRRGLLRGPDEDPPSPKILKIALVAAAIIVVIALILYLKARKAPPALRNELRGRAVSFYAGEYAPSVTLMANCSSRERQRGSED